jgi:hypothetical protein
LAVSITPAALFAWLSSRRWAKPLLFPDRTIIAGGPNSTIPALPIVQQLTVSRFLFTQGDWEAAPIKAVFAQSS